MTKEYEQWNLNMVIRAGQPSCKSFMSGLKKSPKYFTDCFNLSAVNQPLASSDKVLARISDIASGAMMFAVMILVQGECGQTPAACPIQLSPLRPNTNTSFPADFG